MKNLFLLTLVCLLVLAPTACQVVSGDNSRLRSGQALTRDLVISGGSSILEPGSRVTGSVWVSGGSVRADGDIDGDVVLSGGSINCGSSAVVRGTVRMTGGGVHIAEGARVPPVQSYVPKLPAPIQAYIDSVNWQPIWPLLILVPGILCLAAGRIGSKRMVGLTVPGSMLAMLGLISLFQNTFDMFQTWAYAWALVLPTSVGIGMYIEGVVRDQPAKRELGMRVAQIGLVIFVLLAAFFELAIDLSGLAMGRVAFGAGLILIGALLLVVKSSPKVEPAR